MINKRVKNLFGIVFLVSILYLPSFLFAETQIQVQEDEISIDVSPNSPQPYEDVTISVTSYATDLSKAIITWKGASGVLLSGIGKTTYSFKALGPNTRSTINISIKPVDAIGSINKSVTITPSEIELLWESVDGYTPPFYKGKALTTKGGLIKVVAIPNTDTIKSGNGKVSYSWKNNDSAMPDLSGYNKNSYTFKNDIYSNENIINVSASSVSQNYNAEKTIEIPAYNPKILFYKKSPLEGTLYNKVLDANTTFKEDEISIVAEPYFLSIKNSSNISYAWKINGDSINTPSKKTELTIRPTDRGGYATIDLVMENLDELFQKVEGILKLTL